MKDTLHPATATAVAPPDPAIPPGHTKPIRSTPPRDEAQRAVWGAVRNGWRRRCPHCGNGPLLCGYLRVNDNCTVCREELHHHRADDGPAYLTILIVGHLLMPAMFVSYIVWRPDPLALFSAFAVSATGLSLYLLPRLKGAMVGFQWARHMHGFGRKR